MYIDKPRCPELNWMPRLDEGDGVVSNETTFSLTDDWNDALQALVKE